MNQQKRNALKNILRRVKINLIQETPVEISACEICRKTECSEDEWIRCENRIAHAKCLEELRVRKAKKEENQTAA